MTKKIYTLKLISRRWMTALESAKQGGVLALSQRCGEYESEGWKILRKWVTTNSGSRVMAYRCVGRVSC